MLPVPGKFKGRVGGLRFKDVSTDIFVLGAYAPVEPRNDEVGREKASSLAAQRGKKNFFPSPALPKAGEI